MASNTVRLKLEREIRGFNGIVEFVKDSAQIAGCDPVSIEVTNLTFPDGTPYSIGSIDAQARVAMYVPHDEQERFWEEHPDLRDQRDQKEVQLAPLYNALRPYLFD